MIAAVPRRWSRRAASVLAIAVLVFSAADARAEYGSVIAADAVWRASEARANSLLELRVRVDAEAERETDRIADAQTDSERHHHERRHRAAIRYSIQLQIELRQEIDRMTAFDRLAGFALDRRIAANEHVRVEQQALNRAFELAQRRKMADYTDRDRAIRKLKELQAEQRRMRAAIEAARARSPRPPPGFRISRACLENPLARDCM